MIYDEHALSHLIIEKIVKEGGKINLKVGSLKEILIEIITKTSDEKLAELIRRLFPHDPMYKPISELTTISPISKMHLQNAGLFLVGQLAHMTKQDIEGIRSFGKKRANELIAVLEQEGIKQFS